MSKSARKKRQRALRNGKIVKPKTKAITVYLTGTSPPIFTEPQRWIVTEGSWKPAPAPDPAPEPVVLDPKEVKRQELRDELRRLFERRRKQGYRGARRINAPMMPRISYLTQQLRELRN